MNPVQRTPKLISHVLSSSQPRSTDISHHSPSSTSPSKVYKIGKRMGYSKEGSRWIRRRGPHVTISSLPDEVLLDIFEFCLPPDFEVLRAKTWPKLVHVCQRWRYIIFASPLCLDLRLLCTDWTPVREMLDIWPPLPIQIDYSFVSPRDEDNIMAALEHRNRVRGISLSHITMPLENLVAVMEEPFPELESLSLHKGGTMPVLPNTFLGGSAPPRLGYLSFIGIPFPTLPQFLLSSNDLLYLSLYRIPHSGYISPEAMAMCISALTSLRYLSIGFESPASHPDPTNRRPPPLTRAVLPTLTGFGFRGVSEYVEDLMAQIDAPLLHHLEISFFNRLVFDIQQVPRFIGHAPALTMPYNSAIIGIYDNHVKMTFREKSWSSIHESLSFEILCRAVDWQVSSVAQICNQLSFILSSIDQLGIDNRRGSIRQVDMDDTQWLELLQPFTAVQTLRILSDDIESLVVPALRGLSGELATQVLPALEELQLSGYQASQRYNWPFIIARQHSDHPVVLGKSEQYQ
ncbi:hypothetical protein BGW80DRAFT_1565716 [Lactifluus volemus]|nr:hypothetical protein BGW80DRAFT_1565716 [Lactifluus volemus]